MQIAGAILLLVFLSLIAGMALCAGCDRKLDMSPSHLSEVLAGGGDRHRKFDLDELEAYIARYNDPTPILYLVAKYLPDAASASAAAMQRLAEFADALPALLAHAGVKKGKRP